ncbi:Oidioi.mRNA.OKI2018_I69.chr1.g1711.t1.cds [Oikopleura dioica]|uniref:Oidioi.mRNA.OKI2018_I69.chr1.g1711.t1.cds n=1 Tax=Oikopleura dioica TaxID=34765 RepID=A0ABN7SS84_OIKDI|nr:Oidioi.mRNA.OKI2018_I69.chr1.g1711.t1.cds [Oikopleura dioica]
MIDSGKAAFLIKSKIDKNLQLSLDIPAFNWTNIDNPCFNNHSTKAYARNGTHQLFNEIENWINENFKEQESHRHRRFIGDPFRINFSWPSRKSQTKAALETLNKKSTTNAKETVDLVNIVNKDLLEIQSEVINDETNFENFVAQLCDFDAKISALVMKLINSLLFDEFKSTITGISHVVIKSDLQNLLSSLCSFDYDELYTNCANIISSYPLRIKNINSEIYEDKMILQINATAKIPSFEKLGNATHILEGPKPISNQEDTFIYEKLILPHTIAISSSTSTSLDLCEDIHDAYICSYGQVNNFKLNKCATDLANNNSTKNCETTLIKSDKDCLFSQFQRYIMISHFNQIGISYFDRRHKKHFTNFTHSDGNFVYQLTNKPTTLHCTNDIFYAHYEETLNHVQLHTTNTLDHFDLISQDDYRNSQNFLQHKRANISTAEYNDIANKLTENETFGNKIISHYKTNWISTLMTTLHTIASIIILLIIFRITIAFAPLLRQFLNFISSTIAYGLSRLLPKLLFLRKAQTDDKINMDDASSPPTPENLKDLPFSTNA